MSKQYYMVMVDHTLNQFHIDSDHRSRMAEHGREPHESVAKRLKDFSEGALVPDPRPHVGGRGNGAVGGVYTKEQLKRIIGRYPEGVATAVPIATGYTQAQADDNASEAEILSQARAWGVDNWEGWMEWAPDEEEEEEGEEDE